MIRIYWIIKNSKEHSMIKEKNLIIQILKRKILFHLKINKLFM